jgi:hypothetical protein
MLSKQIAHSVMVSVLCYMVTGAGQAAVQIFYLPKLTVRFSVLFHLGIHGILNLEAEQIYRRAMGFHHLRKLSNYNLK